MEAKISKGYSSRKLASILFKNFLLNIYLNDPHKVSFSDICNVIILNFNMCFRFPEHEAARKQKYQNATFPTNHFPVFSILYILSQWSS